MNGTTPLFFIAFLFAGWAFSRLMVQGLMDMIRQAGFLRPNYKGDDIPVGMGLVILLSSLSVLTVAFLFFPEDLQNKSLVFLLAVSGFTCFGLIDDVWGSRSVTGLKGHFICLLKGQITTGALKALAGGVVALFLAAAGGAWQLIPLNAAVIALSVNAVNLLDLRPGRAGKVFLAITLVLFIALPNKQELVLLAAVAGGLLAYLPYDLKARAMMGDTGANSLGAALGLTAVWVLDTPVKIVYLLMLVAFHLFAEKYSLTKVIAGNRFLDYLDKLGRG